MPDVLEVYRRAQEKWGLPHLEKLQAMFQIELEDGTDLEEIRNEISNRLFDFTERVIEPLLWSMHHCHIIEREMLSHDEAQKLFEMYKQIQALRWKNHMLSIQPDEDQTAMWIRDMWGFWKKYGQVSTDLCFKFANGWANLRFKESVMEYQG